MRRKETDRGIANCCDGLTRRRQWFGKIGFAKGLKLAELHDFDVAGLAPLSKYILDIFL